MSSGGRRKRGRPSARQLRVEPLESRCLLTATVQATPESVIGDSINAFARDLYGQLQQQYPGNLAFSPLSISTALAMVYAGAGGETAAQMASTLHLAGLDPNAVAAAFGSLLADLNSAGKAGNFDLSVADALWGQAGFPFNPDYLSLLQSSYGAGLRQADFSTTSAAEAARQVINTWVADQTNQKIQGLFPPHSLDPDGLTATELVLANAIYFNDQWLEPFDPAETCDAPFTLASGEQITASTMNQLGGFGYMDSDGYQVLQMPYADGRLAMDILLPTQTGAAGLDASNLPPDLGQWLSGLSNQQVIVSLPKFQITTESMPLVPSLENLGMTDAFNPFAADFSGISSESLNISTVFHEAFVEVNETGTEAAAATGIGMVHPTCFVANLVPPVVFNADHPFEFIIRDTQSGSVLFMGQVTEPQAPTDNSSPGGSPSSSQPPLLLPAPPAATKPPATAPLRSVNAPPPTNPIVTGPVAHAPPVSPPAAPTNPVTHTPPVVGTPSTGPAKAPGFLPSDPGHGVTAQPPALVRWAPTRYTFAEPLASPPSSTQVTNAPVVVPSASGAAAPTAAAAVPSASPQDASTSQVVARLDDSAAWAGAESPLRAFANDSSTGESIADDPGVGVAAAVEVRL
jgi:serpin B